MGRIQKKINVSDRSNSEQRETLLGAVKSDYLELPEFRELDELSVSPQYPFSGTQARILFILIVLLTLAVALDTCGDYFKWSRPTPTFTINLYIIVLSGGIIAFSLAKGFSDFGAKCLLVSILFGPLVIHIAFKPSVLLYLLWLVIMAIWAVKVSLPKEPKSNFEHFLTPLYVLWVLASILVAIGERGFLPYYIKVSDIDQLQHFDQLRGFFQNQNIKRFLDLRYIFSFLFALSLVAKSFWEACNVSLPNIPRLPHFAIATLAGKSNSIFMTLVFPFVLVTTYVLRFLILIADTMWRMVATICFYLYQFISKFILCIYSYFVNAFIWRGLLKVFASYFVVVVLTYSTIKVSQVIIGYMISSYNLHEFLTLMAFQLTLIILFFIANLIFLSFFRAIWYGFHDWRTSLDRSAMAGAILVLSFTLSGILLYLIKYTNIVNLNGYDHIGPFILLMAGVMGLSALYAIGKQVLQKS